MKLHRRLGPSPLLWLVLIIFNTSIPLSRANAQNIHSADSLYRRHQYKKSALMYFTVFNQSSSTITNANLLNAARACSKARITDSLFKYLFIITSRHGVELYDGIIYDPALLTQHHDKRWQKLSAVIERQEQTFKAAVANELITIYHESYQMARQDSAIANHYGSNSLKRFSFLDTVRRSDSINTLKLKSILNTYGIPGVEEIGDKGLSALIYIYRKAPIAFQKRYFSFIAEAFKNGSISASNYAMIADRISLFDTGRQIYGTQFKGAGGSLYPIENPDSVNIRRQIIGLDLISNKLPQRPSSD